MAAHAAIARRLAFFWFLMAGTGMLSTSGRPRAGPEQRRTRMASSQQAVCRKLTKQ
jgi:hypothetical protein